MRIFATNPSFAGKQYVPSSSSNYCHVIEFWKRKISKHSYKISITNNCAFESENDKTSIARDNSLHGTEASANAIEE